jgi:phosphoglycolate phosphatase-like HAD superfamily hydrolase
MEKVKYIFFDFDGTVSDAKKLTYETLLDILDSMDFKFSRLKLKKMMGAKMPKILDEVGIDGHLVDKIRKKFYNNLVKKSDLSKLKLCSDVKPLYDLKKEGVRLIVLSNAEKSFVEASIRALGLEGLFYRVYGAHKSLTKDEVMKKLFKKFKINGKDVMYVGDRFSDMDYAHRAEMIAVAIHNDCSWSSLKEMIAEDPDFIIHDFDGLKELYENFDKAGK